MENFTRNVTKICHSDKVAAQFYCNHIFSNFLILTNYLFHWTLPNKLPVFFIFFCCSSFLRKIHFEARREKLSQSIFQKSFSSSHAANQQENINSDELLVLYISSTTSLKQLFCIDVVRLFAAWRTLGDTNPRIIAFLSLNIQNY